MWETLMSCGLSVLFGACITGCEAFQTGPEMAKSVMKDVELIVGSTLSQVDWGNVLANASGQVVNPEYITEGVAGTGIYWKAKIQMVGGDLKVGLQAAGEGGQFDRELFDKITDIQNSERLSVQARKDLILQTIAEWVRSKAGPTPEPATPP